MGHVVGAVAKVAWWVLKWITPTTNHGLCTVAILWPITALRTSVTKHIIAVPATTSPLVAAITSSSVAFCYLEEATVHFVFLIWSQCPPGNRFWHSYEAEST